MTRLFRLLFGFISTCSFDLEPICLPKKLDQSCIVTVFTPTLVILPPFIRFDFTLEFLISPIAQVNSVWIRVSDLAQRKVLTFVFMVLSLHIS